MISLIATAWLALATAAISPGPNLVAVASRGLGSGRNSALIVAGGLACGAFLWSFLTAVGLGSLFGTYPQLLKILGLFGGAYLLWLGIKGWRAALTGKGGQIEPKSGQGPIGDFLHGLTVTSTNPKVALLGRSRSRGTGACGKRIEASHMLADFAIWLICLTIEVSQSTDRRISWSTREQHRFGSG